jgi:hypothetical protein
MSMENLRMEICRKCPLYTERRSNGPVCSSSLYINPNTNEISLRRKEGYVKGCGCALEHKTKSPDAVCPINKW